MNNAQRLFLIGTIMISTCLNSTGMRVNIFDINDIDESQDKRWVVPTSLYAGMAYNGFANNSELRSLSSVVFGQASFTVQDIFLVSRLSNENKMRNANIPPLAPVRPGGSSAPFGNYRTDQYLSAIAPIRIIIEPEQRELTANVGFAYRFFWDKGECLIGSVGANVPIRSILHIMPLTFTGGSLFFQNLPLGGDIAETTLTQFFKDFISVDDLFVHGILQSKGLEFHERQRRTGIGDISTYVTMDWAEYFNYMDALQLAVNFVLPSGNKPNANTVWEVLLGNGGAFQVEGSLTLLFNSPLAVFNPALRFVGQLSASFNSLRRVPKLRIQDQQPRVLVAQFDDLIVPMATFRGNYYVDTFEQYDSCIAELADLAIPTSTKYGSRFLVSIGNYFYNVMDLGLRLGVFYDYMMKGKDKVSARCTAGSLFNTCLLERFTAERFHRFGWNLTYKFQNLVELNIGSQHIIAGRNVPRLQELYVSFIAVF